MTASVTIGEFSRLTHLSVKTLHHYHDINLLAPALVDPSSGYRRYEITQVPTAQLIRRLRELRMPLAQVREVIEAPDVSSRDQALRLHLDQMERELIHTQQVVTSLRSMLTLAPTELPVEYRFVPAFRAYAVRDRVSRDDINAWCGTAFARLGGLAGRYGITAVAGATYSDEFFADDAGEVTAFLPVDLGQPADDTVELLDFPAGFFAVALHHGPFEDLDRTYGALGSHVAEFCEIASGPVRELYVVGPGDTTDPNTLQTEICWPIQQIPTKG
ncbi:MerR family transcriptional regulator [Kribbella sp. ALI-6-A]|uniref:MerR family transcriptional regulator n=1 Tax=Kribbella sp. ALI-6-A TaxID=1933817 RepID=UPI00097C9317|nr:MerR family transcriptional regulator [Kribbella sp. ALI-6-A]ONI72098.1 MerR family transcriptional regulator [Kribbella sp. ALI-6-A]